MVETATLIKTGNRPPFPEEYTSDLSESSPSLAYKSKLKSLIEECWQDDSSARPSWDAILVSLREIQASLLNKDGITLYLT